MEILVNFPPPKVHSPIKGASFIKEANHQHTVVRLRTDPGYRKVQVKNLEQVSKSLGRIKSIPFGMAFQRVGKTVNTLVLPPASHVAVGVNAAMTPAAFWFQSPALVRVYLAIAHLIPDSLSPVPKPTSRDVTDLAHLPWLLREKAGVAPWKWQMNGTKPSGLLGPLDVGDLTPVFTGATLWVVGKCRIRLKRGA